MTKEIINRLEEEPVARLVYDGMRWAAEHAENRSPPPWVEGGNATAQGEARHIARAILSTLENLTPSGVERAANQMFDESQTMVCEEEEGIIRRFWNELGEQERKDWRRLASAALALPSEPPSQGDVEGRARELLPDALNAAYRQGYKDGFVDAQTEPPEDERDIHRLIDTGALSDGWGNFIAYEGGALIARIERERTALASKEDGRS